MPPLLAVLALLSGSAAAAQQQLPSIDTTDVGPVHFLAAHGRQALAAGYPAQGLDLWAYPFQILGGYRIAFRHPGAASFLAADAVLRRTVTEPGAVTRVYAGGDFVLRERILPALEEPEIRVTYTLEAVGPLEIEVSFEPVMDLMWPGSAGGQSIRWDDARQGYELAETSRHFHAWVRSGQQVAHDPAGNRAAGGHGRYAMVLRAAPGAPAQWELRLQPPGEAEPAAGTETDLEQQSARHYREWLAGSLEIETPDASVNQALQWAAIAVDQSWVCSPRLGCGLVAGYGPNRPGRRPQYAWFFAGDGMVGAAALTALGDYAGARRELAFLARYQAPDSGMMWHELSQSAAFLDWTRDYPYMFVHVDVTFEYLEAMAAYVRASGDLEFARRQWGSIAAAYRYCRSLLAADGLPHIPAGKEGGDEQNPRELDLELSSSWVGAATAYAELAAITANAAEAGPALAAARRAREAIPEKFWNPALGYWTDGFRSDGSPLGRVSLRPSSAISRHLFPQAQEAQALDCVASADFLADWGARSVPVSSPGYDPDSYAGGSVSALASAEAAAAMWSERPWAAFPLWRSLVAWDTLDSAGHMHEVLSGAAYRQQEESVPEQLWSSAGLLTAATAGLLGLEVNGLEHTAVFAPRLPAEWDRLSVRRIRVAQSLLGVELRRRPGELAIDFALEGPAITLRLSPALPPGARLSGCEVDGRRAACTENQGYGGPRAELTLAAQGGRHIRIFYRGGVDVSVPRAAPRVGDPSTAIKLIRFTVAGDRLEILADAPAALDATLELHTQEALAIETPGARLDRTPFGYRVTIAAQDQGETQDRGAPPGRFRRVALALHRSRPASSRPGL